MEENVMEESGKSLIKVCEYRSLTKSVTLGMSTAFRRMGEFLRHMSPLLALTVVLPMPFYVLEKGWTDALMRKWNEQGRIPEMGDKDTKSDVARCTRRAVVECLCDMAVICLAVCAVLLAVSKGMGILLAAGVVFLLFLLYVPFEAVFMEISYSDKPILKCFGMLKKGIAHYGRYFSLCMFCLLVGGLTVSFGCLPLAVAASAGMQARVAFLSGDALDLPALFPLYLFCAYVLGMLVVLVTAFTFNFCRVLVWGSLVEEVPADAEMDGEGI